MPWKKTLLFILALTVAGAAGVQAASSQQNRGDSLVFVGISPFGLHIPTLATFPVTAGVYLGENIQIGGEYGTAEASYEENDEEAEATYTNAGGYVRWYPGTNSFNVMLAMHNRTFTADATATVTDQSTGQDAVVNADMTASATVGTLGLGNQWMFDYGLFLGFDWVVLSGLVSGSVSSDVDATGTLPNGTVVTLENDETREAEQDLEDLGNFLNQVSATPGLFVFTIGWAF